MRDDVLPLCAAGSESNVVGMFYCQSMVIDPDFLDYPNPDALDLVVEVADMMSMFAAQRLGRINALRREALDDAARAGRVNTSVVLRGLGLEVAAALRITEHAAGALIALAEAVVQRYPAVLASLERAGVTERHVEILVAALDELEPDLRADLLPQVLAAAEEEPVGTFRRTARAMVDAARAVTLAERHEEALTRRRVALELVDDGMAWLHMYVPAVEAHAIFGRVTAMGKAILASETESVVDGDQAPPIEGQHAARTLDQIRADVASDLLIDGTTLVHSDEARGIRASVVVTVPALALLAENDADRHAQGLSPALVEGIGPIPLAQARELCGGESSWMRVLTHPETGIVLSVGRDQYRPPPSLRKLVKWRADRCMAPGCGVPASRCEVDHTVAWEHGGGTSLSNLAPICKGHHMVKHHGGWRVRQVVGSGGALEWTSPAGRRYVVQPERCVNPERIGPVFQPLDEAPPF